MPPSVAELNFNHVLLRPRSRFRRSSTKQRRHVQHGGRYCAIKAGPWWIEKRVARHQRSIDGDAVVTKTNHVQRCSRHLFVVIGGLEESSKQKVRMVTKRGGGAVLSAVVVIVITAPLAVVIVVC